MRDSVTVIHEYDSVAQVTNEVVMVALAVEQGMRGAPGDAIDALTAVEDDLSPSLGGNLTLGVFSIIGGMGGGLSQVIIDGGNF